MRIGLALPALAVVFVTASCVSKPRRPAPKSWFPDPAAEAAPPNYALPWAAKAGGGDAPMPLASATTAPSASAAATPSAPPAETAKCLSDAGTVEDCQTALGQLARAPAPSGTYDVYHRACEKKAKLLGCGAFKSTAISEDDHPTMELLMLCESGKATACEDVKTKVAPLQAWLSTLKTSLCKKGESALCADYHQCKRPTKWTCSPVSGAADRNACGCQPPCEAGLQIRESDRKWPDGSTRASYFCAEAQR